MNKRIPIAMGFIFIVLAIWLQMTPLPSVRQVLLRLENIAYDMSVRTQLLTNPHDLKNSAIVIVDIDEESLQKEGRWPWSRAKLGKLIDNLQAAGAVVIALDMIFPQQQVNIVDQVAAQIDHEKLKNVTIDLALKKIQPFFNNDAQFASSMSDGDTILGVSFLQKPWVTGILLPPLITLTSSAEKKLGLINMNGVDGANPIVVKGSKNQGFINVFSDGDGIIRRVPLLLRYHDGVYPSLALEAVRVYWLATIKLVTASYGDSQRVEGVQLGDYMIPTDSRGQVIIPFAGKGFTFPYLSATDVLHNHISPGILSGKIVFIGTSSSALGDLKATAIQSAYPGVEIHATIADGILNKNFPYKPAWAMGAEIVIIVLFGIVCIVICPYLGPKSLTLFMIIIPVGLMISNAYLREKTGLIISIFIPIALSASIALINLIYGYVFESRRREHIKQMFGQYVPEEHINEMLKTNKQYGLYGEDREMTVLFADIRHFTSIAEPMMAAQLKDYLNAYLNPMTEIIFKHHGTIDKYVGDMIMAFWGAPLADRNHPRNALCAALDMQSALSELNKNLLQENKPAIHIGIGINTGMMSVGDMGSKFRRNYTVLGDAVNLGSRAEGLTKHYGVDIIATEYTIHHQEGFLFRLLDRVRVKGKDNSIDLYEVIGRLDEVTSAMKKEVQEHESALNAYFQQQWLVAEKIFLVLSEEYPHKKLYAIYLERINHYISQPPKNWDGVFTLTHK